MGLLTLPQLEDDESTIDDQYVRTYTRTYRVYADTGSDSHYVRNNLGISIALSHPDDLQALCKGIKVRLATKTAVTFYDVNDPTNVNNGTLAFSWLATVEYGLWNPLEHSSDGDPINQPMRFRLEGVNTPEPIWETIPDDAGATKPICNSAGDYFDPPVEGDVLRLTMRVQRNERLPAIATLLKLANNVNRDVWNGFPARTVKIDPIVLPEREYSQVSDSIYYPMEYTFQIRFDTWDKVLLDQGKRRLVTSGGTTTLQNILIDGIPTTSDVLLNGSGAALPSPIVPANVVYMAFEIYQKTDFTVLDMDMLFS
jgi:hypothetical protein